MPEPAPMAVAFRAVFCAEPSADAEATAKKRRSGTQEVALPAVVAYRRCGEPAHAPAKSVSSFRSRQKRI